MAELIISEVSRFGPVREWSSLSNPPSAEFAYSHRNDVLGSMREARRAGI